MSGKLKEELKMFLLLKENGGVGEVNKTAALLTNPLFPCRVQHSTVETEKERVCVFSDLPAASSLSETNKTTVGEKESHASSLVHTIKVHGGAGKLKSRLHCRGVCCNITAEVCFSLGPD